MKRNERGIPFNAITQSPKVFGAVIKDMPQMAVTVGRSNLRSAHAVTLIRSFVHIVRFNWFQSQNSFGQPQLLSNLSRDENSGSPDTIST